MFASIRQLIAILDPTSRLHFALLLIPMLGITALEIASIGLILPVIEVLLLGKRDGMLTIMILDVLPAAGRENPAPWVSGVFIVFFAAKNVLMLAMIYVVNRVINFKTAAYNQKMFHTYLSRPLIFHYRNNSANLLRNITSGVNICFEAIRLILMMVLDSLLMLGAVALLLVVEPVATLAVTIMLLLTGLTIFEVLSPIFHYWGERCLELEGRIIKWINQSLIGIRDVKLLNAYDYLTGKMGEAAVARARFVSLATTSIHIPRLLIETLVVIVFFGVVFILLANQKPADNIIAILGLYGMAALRLMPSMNRLVTSATDLRKHAPYISVIFDDLRADEKAQAAVDDAAPEDVRFEREIRLENVTYAYPDATHHALHSIDLAVRRGRSVGIVGQSGVGKSTLMDIILGLLTPDQGRLLIDGRDVSKNLAGWRRRIGFVPQQVFILDDTVRRNVAFGMEDADIDEDRVKTALRLARLDDFVLALPDGLDTVMGEHGTRLSGGQRQRIAIARALYRDPDVLMFDEATSSLDSETESEIGTAIEGLAGEKTVMIVAHRLSTVRRCDVIVFMQDGRIADTGTFDDLISGNRDFERLVRRGGFGAADGRVEAAS